MTGAAPDPWAAFPSDDDEHRPPPPRDESGWGAFSDVPPPPRKTSETVEAVPEKKEPLSAGDVASQALENLPSSAAQFGKDMVQPILHPIDTARGLGALGLGIIQKIRNLSPEGQRGSLPAFDETAADAVGKHFVDRYGSVEGIKNAIATDPVGVAADVSVILTGGGTLAAKLPGVAGKVGEVAATAGRALDPVNAVTKPAGAVGKYVAEPLASHVLGTTTGAGAAPIREAAAAGRAGGSQQAAFLRQMRGNAPIDEVVESARAAVNEMRQQRGDAYRAAMDKTKSGAITRDPTVLDFQPIDDAVNKVASVGTFNGKTINQSAVGTWDKINHAVEEWRASDPAIFHTVEGLDALKRKIGDIRDSTDFGKPERRVADEVYHAVRGQIVNQAPTYGKVMKGYEDASAALRDLEGSLSLGNRGTVDSAVRKLQSIMRNNVHSNYGRRLEMGKALQATKGGAHLMPQIAGQALSSATPRGLHALGATAGGVGAGLLHPTFLPALALASPRIVGEGAHAAGQVARGIDRASGIIDPYTARMAAVNAGRLARGEAPGIAGDDTDDE